MKALFLFALLIPQLALAANGSPDSSFYRSLAEGGMAEVDLGKLASNKAADPSVKDFGAMMVKDHSAANQELKSLAASKNVSLPDGPGVAAQAKKAKLEALSGSTFDKSYLANQSTVTLLQTEISSGKDPDAKAFAQKVLPTVQSHLSAAEKIADSLRIKSHQ
jgi:putative membrane protein